jgi:hypothetical protein
MWRGRRRSRHRVWHRRRSTSIPAAMKVRSDRVLRSTLSLASETCMKDAEIMRQNARFRSSWEPQLRGPYHSHCPLESLVPL